MRARQLITHAAVLLSLSLAVLGANEGRAAVIGIDGVHGFDSSSYLASGSYFADLRTQLTNAGHTLVPLASFNAGDLAGLDSIILLNNYNQNAAPYSASEMTAIHNFVTKAVFTSDSSMFANAGDRPLGSGDNALLVSNAISWFASAPGGMLALGDAGSGNNIGNYNALMAPYGVSWSTQATHANGYTVTGFVPHPVTAGLSSIGVDYQLPLNISGPAIDLTTGTGVNNVLAAYVVPEPGTGLLVGLGLTGLAAARKRRRTA